MVGCYFNAKIRPKLWCFLLLYRYFALLSMTASGFGFAVNQNGFAIPGITKNDEALYEINLKNIKGSLFNVFPLGEEGQGD